ncbi:MAG: sulfatase [Kiritimatiellales bacterium]
MKLDRREFLKKTSVSVLGLTAGGNAIAAAVNRVKKKNILMIVADQWRWDWMPDMGMSCLNLPNLSNLLTSGTHFTYCICNSPQCAPSRISFASGLYSGRTGSYQNNGCVYPIKLTEGYPSAGFLPDEEVPSMYSMLMRNGYRTGTVGKHDLLKGSDIHATDELYAELGFTDGSEYVAYIGRYLGQVYPNQPELEQAVRKDEEARKRGTPRIVNPFPIDQKYFYDNVTGRKEIELQKEMTSSDSGQPWMMLVNFHAPHGPWNSPREYFDRYKTMNFPPSVSPDCAGKSLFTKERSRMMSADLPFLQEIKAHYAAKMKVLDEWIGRFRKQLEEAGEADSTVIIFTADHGEMMGDFGLFSKEQMYEGSLRVPLVIDIPGMIQSRKNNALVELVDIYPTLMDLAGISYDPKQLDGKSLLPLIAGGTGEHKKYLYAEWGGMEAPPYARLRMVCDTRYKLINTEGFQELYDLLKDPQERTNIADREPTVVRRLQKEMDNRSARSLPPQRVVEL